jgi:hypothetical protein
MAFKKRNINRFDGYKIINFFENSSVHKGLASNFTRCLAEDSLGNTLPNHLFRPIILVYGDEYHLVGVTNAK